MKPAWSLPALLLLAAPAAAQEVAERGGDVHYLGADGKARQLTSGGGHSDPALAPDGRTIALVRLERPADADGFGAQSSLWLADGITGRLRRLLAPAPHDEPERNLALLRQPVFSPDGRYVYVEAEAWATSEAIHRVEIATGKTHFVADGWLYGVLRNGRYRGHLLVGQHRYHGPPHYGSYNPVSVIRPDGKRLLRIPGSETDGGDPSLQDWLREKGWSLSGGAQRR